MRRPLSIAAGFLGVLLVIGAAAAATSQPDRNTRSGWWWLAQTEDGSMPTNGVAADEIAVARQANGETEQAAVWFDVSDVTAPPERVLMRLRQVSDSRQGGGGGILACPLTRSWTEADGGAWSKRPTPDCSNAIGASQAGGDGYWSFDVTSLVWQWASGSRANHGIGLYSSQSNFNPSYEIVLADLQGADVVGLQDGSSTTTSPTTSPTTTTVPPTTTTVPPTTTTVPPTTTTTAPPPELPEAPTVPPAPTTPGVPSEVPTLPGGIPALPELPGAPGIPGLPSTPGLPEAPGGSGGVPTVPVAPPVEPGDPTRTWTQWLTGVVGPITSPGELPGAPGAPGAPGSPAVPGMPEGPGGPGVPSGPGVDPGSPLTTPVTPVPDSPSTPPPSDAPSEPGDPDDAEPAPAAPGSDPSTPGSTGGAHDDSSTESQGMAGSGDLGSGPISTEGPLVSGDPTDQSSLPRTDTQEEDDTVALGVMANDGSGASTGAPWVPLAVGGVGVALCLAFAALYQKRRLAGS